MKDIVTSGLDDAGRLEPSSFKSILRKFEVSGVDPLADVPAFGEPHPADEGRLQLSGKFTGLLTRGVPEPPRRVSVFVPREEMSPFSIIVKSRGGRDRWGQITELDVSPEGKIRFAVCDEGIARSLVGRECRGAKLRAWFGGGNKLTIRIPPGAVLRNPDGSFSGELLGSFSYFAEL